MSEQKFQATEVLRLNGCNTPAHMEKSVIYGLPDKNMIVETDNNRLVVPKYPDDEWLALHEGDHNFVMIPVLCGHCGKWTVHAYFSRIPYGNRGWHSFFTGWSSLSQIELRYRAKVEPVRGFCEVGTISGLANIRITERESLVHFSVDPTDNEVLMEHYRQVLQTIFRYSRRRIFGSRLTPELQKMQLGQLTYILAKLKTAHDRALGGDVLCNASVAAVKDLYRLQESIKSKALEQIRKDLQIAILAANPKTQDTFLAAGIPTPAKANVAASEVASDGTVK